MSANLYEIAVELIGELPIQLEFVYGIVAILLFMMVVFCVCVPFIVMFKVFDR